MSIFEFHRAFLSEYQEFVRSFVQIADERLRSYVYQNILADKGDVWPEPLIQLSPLYQHGETVDELVQRGILHPKTAKVFRKPDGSPVELYLHQVEAIERAAKHESYVLTSGTGSGKSFTYFIPIIDYAIRFPMVEGPLAIVVYPMNALVNSQLNALEQLRRGFEESTGEEFPLKFARYTGQTTEKERHEIRESPPHLILTNYVMGEFLLLRPEDKKLINPPASEAPFFLVFDELHTYRGRQGADVAMLIRRLRSRITGRQIIHVGTSATLLARKGATAQERKEAVSHFASRFFGEEIPPENVIEEALKPTTLGPPPTDEELTQAISNPPPESIDGFHSNPLARFIEHTMGLEHDGHGKYRRRTPRTVHDVARELSRRTGYPEDKAEEKLIEFLNLGAILSHGGRPIFALKLHQFISQTFPLYASLEDPAAREFGTEPISPSGKTMYPIYFCRACGQEYYFVQKRGDTYMRNYRDIGAGAKETVGYLARVDDFDPSEDLPDSWYNARGELKKKWRERAPQPVYLDSEGREVGPEHGRPYYFQPHPFSLCLACGANWTGRESEFTKLTYLGSEGRTSATTALAVSLLRKAKKTLGDGRDKLLTFTDNRQDASLQAGHFNDFVRVVLLRSALYHALERHKQLDSDDLAWEVLEALPLHISEFAQNIAVEEGTAAAEEIRNALASVIKYRLYIDLRHAWRYTQPNLEDVGLLDMGYKYVNKHFIQDASRLFESFGVPFGEGQTRDTVYMVLDELRKKLAIGSDVLDGARFKKWVEKANSRLNDFWKIDLDNEQPARTGFLVLAGNAPKNAEPVKLTARSRLGKALIKLGVSKENIGDFAEALVHLLKEHDLLREEENQPGLYRIPESAIVWRKGTGSPKRDPLRHKGNQESRVNEYFSQLYKSSARDMAQLEAGAHTAQIAPEEREERERRFRGINPAKRRLPYLVASPTLELGVDISDLDVVHLRNLPPTPANYAQRVGRAGRQGQPGIAVAFAGSFSNHDRYFFRRREEMVAGTVRPPTLDIKNESLLLSHIHAEWLAATGLQQPRGSIGEIIDIEKASLPLYEDVRTKIRLTETGKHKLIATLRRVLDYDWNELSSTTPWFNEDWLTQAIERSPEDFDAAFDTWRKLYQSANRLWERGEYLRRRNLIKGSAASGSDKGEQLRREAEQQQKMLLNNVRKEEGDFYPYRYLAAEEFLPGYNLMALPVRAWVPRKTGEYVNRPRYLAITELAPGNTLYHEGGKWTPARLQIPPGGADERTRVWRLCNICGHIGDRQGSRCPYCDAIYDGGNSELIPAIDFVGVTMRRRDRITANEEERIRSGYDLRIGYKLRSDPIRVSAVYRGGAVSLTYASSAELHFFNLGMKRMASSGFKIDADTGELLEENALRKKGTGDYGVDPRQNIKRLGLHVSIAQNALLIKVDSLPLDHNTKNAVQSLAYAIKRGIEHYYQVEEAELGFYTVGTGDEESFLFFERAEGGLGVLRRLAEEPDGLAQVAASALEVLHFSEDGADQNPICAKACYECLLSYSNQQIADQLDRHLAREPLLQLLGAVSKIKSCNSIIQDRKGTPEKVTTSEPEKKLLDLLTDANMPLPDSVNPQIAGSEISVSFIYDHPKLAVIIIGDPDDGTGPAADVDPDELDNLRELGYKPVLVGAKEIREGNLSKGGLGALVRELQKVRPPGHVSQQSKKESDIGPSGAAFNSGDLTWDELLTLIDEAYLPLFNALKNLGIQPPSEGPEDLQGPEGIIGQSLARWGKVRLVPPGLSAYGYEVSPDTPSAKVVGYLKKEVEDGDRSS